MRIGIATYRALSLLLLVLVVVAVWLATDGRWFEAALVVGGMVFIAITQALLLRCQHCGTRPGMWLLAIWTALLSWEIYLADALFLRQCPRCHKSLSETKESARAV
jgi:hypothetical protein